VASRRCPVEPQPLGRSGAGDHRCPGVFKDICPVVRHLLSVLVLRLTHLTAPAGSPAPNPIPGVPRPLIHGADNTKLEAHYRMLMNQLACSRLVATSLSQPGRPLQSDREHHRVLE